jgi:hypothetical protein
VLAPPAFVEPPHRLLSLPPHLQGIDDAELSSAASTQHITLLDTLDSDTGQRL